MHFSGHGRSAAAMIAAAAAACFLFSGCEFGATAESLLMPPMLSEGQEEIYSALEDAVGSDIVLVYPRSGSYRSAFVFRDLDGSGNEEAIVFYTKNRDSDSAVRMNILAHTDTDGWQSVYDHAGTGTAVDQVFFTDLSNSGRIYMGVGYSFISPADKTLRIYSFSDGVLTTEYTESYYKTLRLDLDRDGSEDIAVINSSTENHGAYISLVTDKGEGIICSDKTELVTPSADISSAIWGYIGEGTPAVFIDGLSTNGTISTEVIYCIDGKLRNPAAVGNSDLAALTARSGSLYCRDIDGDGIVEIPSRELFPGYRDGSDAQYITNWNIFDNYTISKKYSSMTAARKGFCFMLPVRWDGLVTLRTDAATGEEVFYKFNGNLSQSRMELLRLGVFLPEQESVLAAQGYKTLEQGSEAVYMYKTSAGDDSLLLTDTEVENNFFLY